MSELGRPRDRVPDRGSLMWSPVSLWRLLATAMIGGAIALGCYWWSEVDHSRKGPVFLIAIGAIAACIAIGCLLLIAWHGGVRLLHRRRNPS